MNVSLQRSAVSGQWSAFSFQRSAVSGQPLALSYQLSAFSFVVQASSLWHRLLACEVTQIKPMLTSFIQKLIAEY
ncbi:MAG: hypothetical protein F6K26_48595 [Moorea sp. SIO2I5]|nr:hypothetical protein [Moorena sp. SIO2I5]